MASPNKQAQPPHAAAGGLDPSLDADPDVDMISTAPESSAQQASDPASDETLKDGEVRQEALDLNMEEARMPLRKDVSLREFLSKMDEYAPVIPDAVTFHALTLAGLPPPPLSSLHPSTNPSEPPTDVEPHTPLHLSRLLALATQKFIADVAADAYQYSRMRSGTLTSNTLSALANPAAGGPAAPAPGAPGAAGPAGAGAAGGGGPKGGTGQHVLGIQRAGFGGGGQGGAQGRAVLTMEDLGMAVGEYGINVRRGEFYR